MLSEDEASGLLVFVINFDGFKIFGLEDLAAVETFNVVDAVASGNHLGPGVVASGSHNSAGNEEYSIRANSSVKPPGVSGARTPFEISRAGVIFSTSSN